MPRVLCSHCWELVQVDESSLDEVGAGSAMRCPVCSGALDAGSQEAAPVEYQVHTPPEKSHQSKEIQEYVHSLEEQARKEQAREPYHRGRPPVDLVAGLILVGCGFWVLVNIFTGGGGLMSSLINGIFPALLLILIGAICLIFWAK
jgi:hypothetical protein